MADTQPPRTAPHDLLSRAQKALQESRFEDAAEAYGLLAELLPGEASIWHDLGLAQLRAQDARQAVDSLERSLALDDRVITTHLNLARSLLQLNDAEGAKEACARGLALDEDHYGGLVLFGHVLSCIGEVGEAEAAYRQAARSQPRAAAAWCGLARLGRLHDPESLESFVEASRLERGEASALHLALALSFDRKGEYDKAFSHASRGNELRRSAYDPELRDELVDRTIRTSSSLPEAMTGIPSEAPIFIVGLPRSGTSLVEEILAAHPRVHALGERTDIGLLARDLPQLTRRKIHFPEGVAQLSPLECVSLGRHYMNAIGQMPEGKIRFTDKAPGNFLFLDLISRLFPNAKIIHCVRDLRDVGISCFMQDFGDHGGVSFASDLEHFARHAEGYMRLMEHLRQTSPLAIHDIGYEDLVADPERIGRALLEFVGLDWDPGCLEFHQRRRPVVTASSQQVREPIHGRAVARWERYGAHLGPLARLA